jgi:hypothetical protein
VVRRQLLELLPVDAVPVLSKSVVSQSGPS